MKFVECDELITPNYIDDDYLSFKFENGKINIPSVLNSYGIKVEDNKINFSIF